MRPSRQDDDGPALSSVTAAEGFAAGVHEVLRQVISVSEPAELLDLLSEGSRRLGATAGCFISFVREADAAATYRMLVACDPRWGSEYLVNGWFESDPWLSHALRSEEPILASDVAVESPAERGVVAAAAECGFRSAVVAPSPSAAGGSRAGVLYLGSDREGYFEDGAFQDVRPLAQAFAMELHAWWLRALRRDLSKRVRISPDELELLRHEDSGRGSKAIAALLGIEAKTIDCRFQRINAKLGAPTRKSAVRIARLYGLD